MKLTLEEFAGLTEPAHVTIHSLEQALYQATVEVAGKHLLLVDSSGRAVREHSLQRLRDRLRGFPVASLALRQESAYDEMIGHPVRQGSNAIEVPLAVDDPDVPIIH